MSDSELRYSGEQGFFDKSSSVRLLIGFAFAFSLFFVLHFREVKVDVLEPNGVAPRYIVAQEDFEFLDQEATAILKQEAVKDIGKIFRISEKQIGARRIEFENQLLKDPDVRRKMTDHTYEDTYNVLDALQKVMMNLRFTDPRTLRRMKETGIPTNDYFVYSPNDIEEEVIFPHQFWSSIVSKYLSQDNYPEASEEYVINFFEKNKWKIDEDIPSQRVVRGHIQAEVPVKHTRVTAGNRIIDQGEKVTSRHIAMLQAMKKVLSEKRNLWHTTTLSGSLLLTLLITLVCTGYLITYQPTLFQSNRRLCLLVTIMIITMALSKAVEYFLLTSAGHLQEVVRYPLFVPFAAILTCNLLNASLAMFVAGLLSIIFTVTLSFDHIGFLLVNLVGSVIAILSTRELRRRKEIFVVCAKSWFGIVLVIVATHLYANTFGSWNMSSDIVSSGLFMLLTSMLVLSLLPLLESAFHIMSDVSMTEYMDPNNELLRRLAFEAPGTYQHSLVVCNLAEAAAISIGANGLFCRVATLYHDVGKMATPHYFTENQQGEMNVHQLLTPLESAQTIMSHVTEGVAMARKAGIPEQFIDIIKEHHGTTLVYYFYRKQLEQAGGDPALVIESDFRYAGPKPHSKESAIIMIADTFEAASRSLDVADEAALTELVNRLVREKADDGQFDECQLTFEELGIVKQTMVQTLLAGLHSRVKYPKRERKIA